MSAITVRFSDGRSLQVEAGTPVGQVVRLLEPELADLAIGAKVGGRIVEFSTPLNSDCELKVLLPTDDEDSLELMRHSAAHVMAEAVVALWPQAKLVYGPAVEDGFYYDIDLDEPIRPEDFERIERKMAEIVAEDRPFVRYELPRDEAMRKLQAEGNEYKLDNARRATGETLSFYVTGQPGSGHFEDLCRGPHVPSTGRIGAFKIMSVAGAYWRGDASQKQLQRLYGTAWPTREQLEDYLQRLERAKQRDHRLLGKQLDLFSIHEEVGAGLVHWHPKGAMIRHVIERFWIEEHLKRGYQLVYTPHIASERIYQRSGHLEKYADMMYSPMDIDGQPYRVKPMNCPGHIMIYQTSKRSYRELPIRMCELGTVYRYERSGVLHGMLRVRGFTQDDSHIFCTPEQLPEEVEQILELIDLMMDSFGYSYKAYLATRPEKYLGTEQQWQAATDALRQALERRGMEYEIDPGGGVFYAPKIDIKLLDSLGRYWQGPTIQVDLNLPQRFGVTYVGPDNIEHETVIIHRTVLGSMERFVGGLIEHYGGNFPLWLAPVQVAVLPISEKFQAYGQAVLQRLQRAGLRVEINAAADKISARIRAAELQKIPYMLVVGAREQQNNTVAVRHHGRGDIGTMPQEEFETMALEEVRSKGRTVIAGTGRRAG